MSNISQKIFVLGLDGGTWVLLNALIEQGHMPNLKKVCSEGMSGTLKSTIPPYTAPAWVSCVTGVNPGKHGVFGFTEKDGDGNRTLISSRSVKVPKIWQYVNEAGGSAGLINIPITYPAAEINGFVIPCFLTPEGIDDFTYPKGLYKEILKEIGSYTINVKISGRNLSSEEEFEHFVTEIIQATRKRFEAMKYLWKRYSPDFFMTVFTSMDKIQHKFWKYMDEGSLIYNEPKARKARESLLKVYKLIDEIIGYVIENIDDNTTLYIVSDHGFGPIDKRVFLNKWLAEEGLLALSKSKVFWSKFMAKTKLYKNPFFSRNIAVSGNAVLNCANMNKTLFYCSDVYEQGIYFNRDSDSFKQGKIDYKKEISILKEKLLSLKDREDNLPIVDEALSHEDVYSGDYINSAPDLLLRMRDYGYTLNSSVPLRGNNFLKSVKSPEGCHRREGIFAAYGKNIAGGSKIEASIMDITPTVLYNMNLPISRDMDGRVLKEIFSPEITNREIIYAETEITKADDEKIKYNTDEELEIKGRLKDLGYFD